MFCRDHQYRILSVSGSQPALVSISFMVLFDCLQLFLLWRKYGGLLWSVCQPNGTYFAFPFNIILHQSCHLLYVMCNVMFENVSNFPVVGTLKMVDNVS